MVRNQLVSLFSLGAALAGLAASYACIAQSAPGSDVALTQLDLARDYRLGAHITLHIASRPVGEVLYTIADLVHAEMRAVSWDREQRISLDVTDRPASDVMSQIANALSHGAPNGWRWALTDGTTHDPAYVMARSKAFVASEGDARDYPRQKAIELLKLMRAAARELHSGQAGQSLFALPAPQQRWLQSPESMQLRESLGAITDGQFASMSIHHPVPLAKITGKAQSLEFLPDDNHGNSPDRVASYTLRLMADAPASTVISEVKLNPVRDTLPDLRLAQDGNTTSIDPSQALQKANVHGRDLRDCGMLFHAIAASAHKYIIVEQFYKCGTDGTPHQVLADVSTGSFEAICNRICDAWNYQALQVGDTYYFWSKTWALDRAADIPDGTLSHWQHIIETRGNFTARDRGIAAGIHTWQQIGTTLKSWLPESGPWSSRTEYEELRTAGVK